MPSCYMYWLIFNVLSAALQADSVRQIRNVSAVSLPGAEETAYLLGQKFHSMRRACIFFVIQTFKHLRVMSQVCVYVFIYMMSLPEVCKSICSAQASCVVPYSIFFRHMSCVFSLSSRGVACPYTYWLTLPLGAFGNQPMVAGSLTGAELRLMTHSQMYRAPCWTAAKWLCLFLWSNSLLSLMLTVVVGYWSLAWLLLW